MPTFIWDGSSQDQRLLPALQAGYVRPDEMGLAEILYLGARHAGLLAFHNLEDRRAGDWQPLFADDESFILAAILVEAKRLEVWRSELAAFAQRMQALAFGLGSCPAADAVPLYRLARQIEDWRAACARSSGAGACRVHELISGLLPTTLAPALGGQIQVLRRYDAAHGAALLAELGPPWHAAAGSGEPPPAAAGQAALLRFMAGGFLAFTRSVALVGKAAADAFPASLASGRHDPAVALYIAFAQLYLKAKSPLDDFSQRHLRFYYERVLRFVPRPPRPDSAHLVLHADGSAAATVVARGTLFLGGAGNDGGERVYASDDELFVSDARVAALRTLYLLRDARHSPEKDMGEPGAAGFVSSAWSAEIPPTGGNSPLFGAPARAGARWSGRYARIGFAFASPVLFLKEGRRDIEFTLHWRSGGLSLDALVTRLQRVVPTSSWEGAFFKAFTHSFCLRLSTARGWREVGEIVPSCQRLDPSLPANALRLRVSLADDFPPLVACTAAVHGESYASAHPVAAFSLAPDAYLYPYDFLRTVFIEQVDIGVRVRGCRDLVLCNQHGRLSAAAPFAPFGPLPRLGAYLVVGNAETAGKTLSGLSLRVRWDGLPPGGLAQHYRDYGLDLGASSFRAELSALSQRNWQPAKKSERFSLDLLGAVDDDGRARYDCRSLLPYLQASASEGGEASGEASGEFAYGPMARNGFVRLELCAPAAAFGHAEYPTLLARALTGKARRGLLTSLRRRLGREPAPALPAPPYTPLLGAITMDYSAQVRFGFEQSGDDAQQGRIYHLHPWGIAPLRLATRGATTLVPDVAGDANLYVGIAASSAGGPLTLHFQLRDDSRLRSDEPRPAFSWYYLRANRWCELEAFRVRSDSTHGFLRSGVVSLSLPRDMSCDDTLMPGGLYWLRISSDSRAERLCSVDAVSAHGVRVTRVTGVAGGSALAGPPLVPAGTIARARVSLPGVGTIEQPEDSFGGEAAESLEALTVRAGERLRHRQRAINPWDYERLVLQRFPHIVMAKCFANTRYGSDPDAYFCPGNVLVVVVSRLKGGQQGSDEKRENVLVLQEIEDYLARFTAPWVRVEVRNPVLERIQVRCRVRFSERDAAGTMIARLNRDIGDFISPWESQGAPVSFGWRLRCQEIESRIQGLPYVDAVAGLSLLRVVAAGNEYYRLHDTARTRAGAGAAIAPLYPWSLPIPFRHHLIESHDAGAAGARPSGIAHLQVGASFIVAGKEHGQEEPEFTEE